MKLTIHVTIALTILFFTSNTEAQVTLQPWTQVYGTVPGQSLGRYVNGNIQSSNFPYNAAVSKVGSTGVYALQDRHNGAPAVLWGKSYRG
jgi:hypothetical protein